MSVKRKNSVPRNRHSWEEQAFAEDARGPLGGFIWPPRSYSCSFCTREFRSAQALGGHMNVHRREKAKLKQTAHSLGKDPAGFFPSRVSSVPALGQESPDSSSSDTKSSVYDEVIHGHGNGNLVLGFDLDSCPNKGVGTGGKRRRTNYHVTPAIMQGGLDLELKLGNFHAW